MLISNRPGFFGVVLAVFLGYQLDAALPPTPGLENLGLWAGALFLGLYGLTVDRCEVPGFLPSYRANLQNFFAAASEAGLGTYDKPVVPGRRMAFFFLPVFLAPVLAFLINLLDVARVISAHGRLLPVDRFQFVEVPVVTIAVWAAYAWTTQSLRMRINKKTHESLHWH